MSSNADQKHQIQKTRQILTGNKIVFTEVDCSMDENRATRDRYFEVSGVRGNYPQVFVQNVDGTDTKYIGSFKEIEECAKSPSGNVRKGTYLVAHSVFIRRTIRR
jgi:glutaredoxin